mgnify:CR=1 FL=1
MNFYSCWMKENKSKKGRMRKHMARLSYDVMSVSERE